MNTRLQVEHPVTELVYGWISPASNPGCGGLPLSFKQEDLVPKGWAIECRIYAEIPTTASSPRWGASPGCDWPRSRSAQRLRDSPGYEVSRFYDPMLGKLIVHGRP